MARAAVTAESDLRINLDRLSRDLQDLAKIGFREEDQGIYRMAFTAADMAGKAWLENRLHEAKLPSWRDGAENVWSRVDGLVPGRPAVIIGSHLDTVPCAGALDGSLGVLVGLECLRVLRERGVTLDCPVELVAFSDEEGRFGGMLGSEAVTGRVAPTRLQESDLDGITVSQAMRVQGLDPNRILEAARDPRELSHYLELHIEQGPVLDQANTPIGIVDEITGLFKWSVTLRGESNHAGTTPMEMRRDAFMGLADFAHELPRILDENGSARSRGTIGKAQIVPGAPNTVPGMVEFSLDVRDTSPAVLDELENACRKALSAIARRRQLKFDFEPLSRIEPVACDSRIVHAVEAASEKLKLKSLRMPSGAAHDAQIMANLVPVGMIFVPSRGGVSHSPAEWTSMHAIEAGANVALQTLLQLAREPRS